MRHGPRWSRYFLKFVYIIFQKYINKFVFFPATTKLEILRVKYGADMAMANYDGRTPLHVAASEGGLEF